MALPFDIHLSAPFIAVSLSQSLWGFNTNGDCSFGTVQQVNYDTVGYNEGDSVLFYQKDSLQFGQVDSGDTYLIINENQIVFREGPPL